jgi:hypothetical protein
MQGVVLCSFVVNVEVSSSSQSPLQRQKISKAKVRESSGELISPLVADRLKSGAKAEDENQGKLVQRMCRTTPSRHSGNPEKILMM